MEQSSIESQQHDEEGLRGPPPPLPSAIQQQQHHKETSGSRLSNGSLDQESPTRLVDLQTTLDKQVGQGRAHLPQGVKYLTHHIITEVLFQ